MSRRMGVLAVLIAIGCDLWPLDHPDDPRRCGGTCSVAQRCHLGRCVELAADGGADDAGPLCGNAELDPLELCDGDELAGKTCKDFSFAGGKLGCAADCRRFDISRCYGCRQIGFLITCSIPAGSFSMGSPEDEPCREPHGLKETPHTVTLTHPFEISPVEMTQKMYSDVTGEAPSVFSECGPDCPVENVTWDEAAATCNWLSVASHPMDPCYRCEVVGGETRCTVKDEYAGAKIYDCPGYRLPTEAEWEYAYRARSPTAYHNGENSAEHCQDEQRFDLVLNEVAWYRANADGRTHLVASKFTYGANAWGVRDMAGNVREWCHDFFEPDLGAEAVTDPVGRGSGAHVIRGGSWDSNPEDCRAAARDVLPPSITKDHRTGFRCARSLDPTTGVGQ